MGFTFVLTKLPKAQQPIGLSPVRTDRHFRADDRADHRRLSVGSYLTETYGWQYIFFVNLVPGAAMVVILWLMLERRSMQLPLLEHGDWFGGKPDITGA